MDLYNCLITTTKIIAAVSVELWRALNTMHLLHFIGQEQIVTNIFRLVQINFSCRFFALKHQHIRSNINKIKNKIKNKKHN